MKIALGVGIPLAALLAFALFRTFHTPADLWITTHQFAGCPARPSCVSSEAAPTDTVHYIAPLPFAGEPAAARAKLEAVIAAMPLASIADAAPEYLHVVFQTPTMHFHDDVELLVQGGGVQLGGVVEVRSLSRFGYGDHGVNRARVEQIREAFAR